MRVVFAAYRQWAAKILEQLRSHDSVNWEIVGVVVPTPHGTMVSAVAGDIPVRSVDLPAIKGDALANQIREFQADVVLFYGWSWMVAGSLLDTTPCICLHPSPLPKYRGGSPLQHQILAGEKESAVTLFSVTSGVDDGPILAQGRLSLEGELADILDRISSVGAELTIGVLDGLAEGTLVPTPQDESQMSIYKRRKPEESEITMAEISSMPAEYIYNKVRALQSPYPNAFIMCSKGKRVYLTGAHL